ncbi:hypothetical protein IFM89_025239 [Coptis chinensis]|uniref:Uncharacterized protein n=1 Tax=Coptis chinensis TaxID=261450 RepID=A0A835GZ13_9MAGN|nr:hypothetical protein IFM89_025239 [Coptis chinensis]
MQASSLRNSTNREDPKKNSSCLGRKSAMLLKRRWLWQKAPPESSIGRVESYKFIHKRKSGVAQDPELVVLNEFIGKECDLRGGWPLRVVARGIVQDVDPTIEFGDRRLEEGNFKVYVNVIYDRMRTSTFS